MTQPKKERILDVAVYDREGNLISHCMLKRAKQMVQRGTGVWRGYNEVTLLITDEDKKAARKEVRERDGNICYLCDSFLAEDEITYDHVIPRDLGGSDLADNLAICCKPCNEQKANMTLEQYLLYLYVHNTLTLGGHVYLKRHLVD